MVMYVHKDSDCCSCPVACFAQVCMCNNALETRHLPLLQLDQILSSFLVIENNLILL